MIRATALKWTSMLALMLLGTITATAGTQQSAGEFIGDGVLTVKVKAALVADETTKAHQINIETFQGVIQLGDGDVSVAGCVPPCASNRCQLLHLRC